jgi:hydroxyacylglutathione hydrolase
MTQANVILLEVGSLATCCYIVSDSERNGCAIIDPGGDPEVVVRRLQREGLTPSAFLITHSHFDHIAALEKLHRQYPNADILCHAECGTRMQSPESNLGFMVGLTIRTPGPTRTLADGELIDPAGLRVRCLFVPGHAPGHMAFYLEEEQMLFCGDTLFNGSLGRTDFDGCSFEDLMESIRNKLLVLPGETKVYPGHGPATTIGAEKESNPFLQGMA